MGGREGELSLDEDEGCGATEASGGGSGKEQCIEDIAIRAKVILMSKNLNCGDVPLSSDVPPAKEKLTKPFPRCIVVGIGRSSGNGCGERHD